MAWLKTRKTEFVSIPQPVLIVCEDAKSSVFYLRKKVRALKLHYTDVVVDGNSGSAPLSVVNYAIETVNRNKKEAKRQKQQAYGKVFCVMDVDAHPNLREAIQKARGNKLIPIVSNECFELWYLLHFIEYSTRVWSREELKAELTRRLGRHYDKGDQDIFEAIRANEASAIALAKRLEQSALADSDARNPLRNPSTEVYKLIEYLDSLVKK